MKSKYKFKAIAVLISVCIVASISINIMESVKSSQRRMYYINHIFFDVKSAVTYIERYFENTDDLFNIEYAGLELFALDALLRANPQEFQVAGVYSFQNIGEHLSVNCADDGIITNGNVSEAGVEYLHHLLQSLYELLSQLAFDRELDREDKNLTYQQINSAISSFYSDFFVPLP